MKARGWRRIGVVLSVMWFLGFGVFLWHQFVEDAVAPYTVALKTCSAIEESSNEFWRANARNSEELKIAANVAKLPLTRSPTCGYAGPGGGEYSWEAHIEIVRPVVSHEGVCRNLQSHEHPKQFSG
jgi:hypothetical protein